MLLTWPSSENQKDASAEKHAAEGKQLELLRIEVKSSFRLDAFLLVRRHLLSAFEYSLVIGLTKLLIDGLRFFAGCAG